MTSGIAILHYCCKVGHKCIAGESSLIPMDNWRENEKYDAFARAVLIGSLHGRFV